MRTRASGQAGFTLIELMIAVLLVGLLAAIAIPNFVRSRTTTQTNACISNLRAIDYAIQQWALEAKQAANSPVTFPDISSYLRRSVICPSGGSSFGDSYLISVVGVEPVCQRIPLDHLLPQTELAGSPVDPSASPAGPTSGSDGGADGGSGTAGGNGNGSSHGHNGGGKGHGKP